MAPSPQGERPTTKRKSRTGAGRSILTSLQRSEGVPDVPLMPRMRRRGHVLWSGVADVRTNGSPFFTALLPVYPRAEACTRTCPRRDTPYTSGVLAPALKRTAATCGHRKPSPTMGCGADGVCQRSCASSAPSRWPDLPGRAVGQQTHRPAICWSSSRRASAARDMAAASTLVGLGHAVEGSQEGPGKAASPWPPTITANLLSTAPVP